MRLFPFYSTAKEITVLLKEAAAPDTDAARRKELLERVVAEAEKGLVIPSENGGDKAFFYYVRGIANKYFCGWQQACNDLSSAIAINPQFAEAYYERSAARIGVNDGYGAFQDFCRAVELNPALRPADVTEKLL